MKQNVDVDECGAEHLQRGLVLRDRTLEHLQETTEQENTNKQLDNAKAEVQLAKQTLDQAREDMREAKECLKRVEEEFAIAQESGSKAGVEWAESKRRNAFELLTIASNGWRLAQENHQYATKHYHRLYEKAMEKERPGLNIHPDQALRLQYEAIFAIGIKIFADRSTRSSEISDSLKTKLSKLKARMGCVACGWNGQPSTRRTISHGESTCLYPHDAAEVSHAHLVRSKEGCDALGVKFNEPTNFLALCGNRRLKPSCHHAFDHHKLCFVFQPESGRWKMYAAADTVYDFLNREPLIDLSAYSPHPHVLHSHAFTCFLTNQIKPVVGLLLEDVPRYEEIDPSLDPVSDLGSSY